MTTFPKYALSLLGNNGNKGEEADMKKSNFVLAAIGFICFMIVTFESKATVAEGSQDLLKIAAIFQDENILINEWSLYAREKVENLNSSDEVSDYVEKLKQKHTEWDWTSKTSKDHVETAAVLKSGSRTEIIKILSTPTAGEFQTYVIYEVKGHKFGPEAEKQLPELFESRLSDIFRGNVTVFSCLKGEFSVKIDETLPKMEQLLDSFQAKEIESLKEENFIAASAYSTMFTNEIDTKEGQMNLQIGMRSQGLGAKTTLVVGTPILTIEY